MSPKNRRIVGTRDFGERPHRRGCVAPGLGATCGCGCLLLVAVALVLLFFAASPRLG